MNYFIGSVLLILCVWIFGRVCRRPSSSAKLPPGPSPLPIIGNLLHLGKHPHLSLTSLSKIYGPIMHLKLGSLRTVVVSSPQIAKEILLRHDGVCSGRPVPHAPTAEDLEKLTLAFMPPGTKWRKLRKICKEHMFHVTKLQASEPLRKEKLQQLLDYVGQCSVSGRHVSIAEIAFVTSLNLISATIFSVDVASFDSSQAQEMKEAIAGVVKLLGTPNISDYFPVFKFIDLQGIKSELAAYAAKILAIIDEIVSERLQLRGDDHSPRKKDLLEVLLDLSQQSDCDLSLDNLKRLCMDLFVGGSETSTVLVEWAVTELLRRPEIMQRAKEELRSVIGENKQLQESDISRLPYLRAVIKETFRYHPTGPFLIPHKAEADVEIDGYMVPKDTHILVNVWAIGRDSTVWSDPDSFEPARFLDSEVDYKGRDFELIPFGSGRRICPGMPLAHVMVHMMVGSLIHNFDWKLEPGIKPEELDMNEILGLSLHKAVPLRAFPVKH